MTRPDLDHPPDAYLAAGPVGALKVTCEACGTVEVAAGPAEALVLHEIHGRLTALNAAAMGGVVAWSDGASHEAAAMVLAARLRAARRR